jgi:uncharacterized membrane protein YjfL (UPF0719 family)
VEGRLFYISIRRCTVDFAIGGILIAALIIGIVEASKEFGLQGVGCRALALALGILFAGLAHGINEALIPAVAVPYIVWAVTAIAGGLAAMGYYDFAKKFFGVSYKR